MFKIAIFCLTVIFTAPNHSTEQASPGIDPIVTGVSISQSEKDAWAERHAKYLAQVASGAVETQDFPE